MTIPLLPHRWNITPDEAIQWQRELAGRVSTVNGFDPDAVRVIAGIDASYREAGGIAAVVALSYPELIPIAEATAQGVVAFPYVPGLLSFRESPLVLEALSKLTVTPDVLFFDGQGIAHPRRLGIASHVGVLLDIPTIGVAKSILTGRHAPLGDDPGDSVPLTFRDEVLGTVLRTKRRSNPLILSVGHKIALSTAVALVQSALRGYRLPEPTRQAHNLAGEKSQQSTEQVM